MEYTICTKCGHCEDGENLSRFCTRKGCNYMRIICSQGKDKEWERERNSRQGWNEEEKEKIESFIFNLKDKNYDPI